MEPVTSFCVLGILGDVAIVCIMGITSVIIRNFATPYFRGFFENDQTIRYPFRSSTISANMLYAIGYSLPTFSILVLEGSWLLIVCKRYNDYSFTTLGKKRSILRLWFWRVYKVCLAFYFGVVVTHLATNIGKYSIGRLRPHFVDVCKPNWSLLNASETSGLINYYIEKNICTGNIQQINEARLSFPSGHSSVAMFCMTFLVIYLQNCLTWERMLLFRPFLQTLLLYAGIYTCMSRVSDYKHHPSDVLAGGFLGVMIAILVVYSLTKYVMPASQATVDGSDNSLAALALAGSHNGQVDNVSDHTSISQGTAL